MPDEPDSRRSLAGGRAADSLWLSLDVIQDAGSWPDADRAERLIEDASRALAAAPQFAKLAPAEACVALSDDASVRTLNHRYRDKDEATNVLSFPASPTGHAPGNAEPRALGDLVLAYETLVREASEQGIPFAHHLQHLVIHGLLHLLGFDHETEPEAADMEAIEVEILASLGIPNPYHDEASSIVP